MKADEGVLNFRGQVDIQRLKPLSYMPDSQTYLGMGGFVGDAFSIGRKV